jgi:hypothetical protein
LLLLFVGAVVGVGTCAFDVREFGVTNRHYLQKAIDSIWIRIHPKTGLTNQTTLKSTKLPYHQHLLGPHIPTAYLTPLGRLRRAIEENPDQEPLMSPQGLVDAGLLEKSKL